MSMLFAGECTAFVRSRRLIESFSPKQAEKYKNSARINIQTEFFISVILTRYQK